MFRKTLRSGIRSVLHYIEWDLVPYRKGYRVAYRPLEGKKFPILQLAIPSILKNVKDFFFVQIGANDGERSDDLRRLVLQYHPRGLLVEPLPDMFEKLKKNYRSEEQLVFANVALARQNHDVSLFRFRHDAPVRDYLHGMATFDEQRIRRLARDLKLSSWIEEVRVRGLTFKQLLEEFAVTDITLLQVDTEGFDFEIIKMALECRKCPDLINYEFTHLSPQDRLESYRLLAAHGYSFIHGDYDTLAVLDRTICTTRCE
jgi:FkbM family methyltransferase